MMAPPLIFPRMAVPGHDQVCRAGDHVHPVPDVGGDIENLRFRLFIYDFV